MSEARQNMGRSAFGGQRVMQWAVVVAVAFGVLYVLGRKAEEVQALAELAAVRSSLANLRTALIIDHLHGQLKPATVQGYPDDPNPFLRLEHLPPNYGGLRPLDQGVLAPPGSWFYDPACVCIGYRIMQPQRLTEPAGSPILGWHVEEEVNGVRTLRPFANYRWMQQSVY